MKIAFILFKYFPFGGLQRDFFRIANLCVQRGHKVTVYTMSWQGEIPETFNVKVIPAKAVTNHKRYQRFEQMVYDDLQKEPSASKEPSANKNPFDIVVGFNKMRHLDVYYAADACYEEKAQKQRNRLYRMGSRYKYFSHTEKAVFSEQSQTEILMISEVQKNVFIKYYHTPDKRFHLLPPGISKDRKAPENASEIRKNFRQTFNFSHNELLLLMIGSGFKTKGLDRALLAVKALSDALRNRVRFIIIGQDNPKKFKHYAEQLGLGERVQILAGRDDIPDFLLAADVLIHPAYNENTGTVLLEAMVAGLPVLVTDVCGYAHYIAEAEAGIVLSSPFIQQQLNDALNTMLTDTQSGKVARQQWQKNALNFSQTANIYSMPERAVQLIELFAENKKLNY